MNLPNVWKRFKQTNILLRQELGLIQKAYKIASSKEGKEVKLLECWDLFLRDLLKVMMNQSRQFVKEYLAKFKEEWVESKKPKDENWLAQVQQVQSFVKEIEKQLGKIQLNLDDLF